ncbi:hypothetical protein F2P45_03870 [Massilia sp. CCM 8733]|uniref:Nucleotidyl transferase AbiEii/AbiGii toxin family protein n=1 Tax=Massilia mucilaginosa TaxID=2609282 RepID=A0ABX0NMY3_9BURK|nr:nucleotidyl transferase AbiEii/AbiGii toxin family protein [Massilia mucilaginosa]NHZ88165.1 hypothetical protein [Massilia mucilaginosa]
MSIDRKDFGELVNLVMANPGLSAMRPVVEKELLHYEIFQALDAEGLLNDLVFQGGTSLRLCRGSDRFSEDLDFAGGVNFNAASMQKIMECVEKRIGARFGLTVVVSNKPATGRDRLGQDPPPGHLEPGLDGDACRPARSGAGSRQDQ